MTKAEIYRRAAELVDTDEDEFACIAIAVAGGQRRGSIIDTQEMENFGVFKREESSIFAWGQDWGGVTYDYVIAKSCRVLALCFAASMAEQGDI